MLFNLVKFYGVFSLSFFSFARVSSALIKFQLRQKILALVPLNLFKFCEKFSLKTLFNFVAASAPKRLRRVLKSLDLKILDSKTFEKCLHILSDLAQCEPKRSTHESLRCETVSVAASLSLLPRVCDCRNGDLRRICRKIARLPISVCLSR